jgi:hypothetical protein
VIDPSVKLMSYDLPTPINAVGRKLAFTRSSPQATLMIVWYTWINSSGLLEPWYQSMLPILNLSSHRTCLSGPVRARNPLLPIRATSSAKDRCGGDGVLCLSVTPRVMEILMKFINKWLGTVTSLNQKVGFKNKVSNSNYHEINLNSLFRVEFKILILL